jgi:hypothetical protein
MPWLAPHEFTAPYAAALDAELADADDLVDPDDSAADSSPSDDDQTDHHASAWETSAEHDAQLPNHSYDNSPDAGREPDAYERFVFSGGRLRDGEMAEYQMDEEDWELSRVAFAGYVSLLDHWLEPLQKSLEQLDDDWLLIVFGSHGIRLGASQDLSPNDSMLADEVLRVPLLMTARESVACERRPEFIQTDAVLATLSDWFSSASPPGSLLPALGAGEIADAPYLCFRDNLHEALRSRDFLYVAPRSPAPDAATVSAQLFEKPDDFWEVLDVGDQNPGVRQQLEQTLLAYQAWESSPDAQRSLRPPLAPPPD